MDVLTVVIADDDELIRESLAAMIETAEGLRLAAVARDADEAVELCRLHKPEVAVLDLNMPGGGPTAAVGIRGVSPDTRLVALSSATDGASRRQMLDAGAADFVVKGEPVVRLLSAIRGGREGDERER